MRRWLERTKKRIAIHQERRANQLRELAGSHWDEIAESKREATAFLRHPEKNVRRAALHALCSYWERNPTDECVTIIEDMALNDNEAIVRGVALMALGDFHQDTSDPRIGRLLAESVVNEGLPPPLRKAGYNALCVLCARKDLLFVKPEDEAERFFRFPEDINWSFVRSFLNSDGQE